MTTYPSHLNTEGQKHVASELAQLGLEWDVAATCSEIEGKVSFSNMVQGEGDSMDYEVSNTMIGKPSHGVFAYIEILADMHVQFEEAE